MKTYKVLAKSELFKKGAAVQIGNTVSYPLYHTGQYLEAGTFFHGHLSYYEQVYNAPPAGHYEYAMIDEGKNAPLTGKYVSYKGIVEVKRKATLSAEGDAPAGKILNEKVGNIMIGAGLVFGLGTAISSYNKFNKMDWEATSGEVQGKAIGSSLGYLTGALISIGIGFAIVMYEQNQATKTTI